MLERILVPLDGSTTAEAVVPHLRKLIRRRDSEVILLRAVEPPLSEGLVVSIEATLGAAREYVAGKKERFEREGPRVRTIVRLGPAAGTILEVAKEEDVSLIAMATHGRTGLKRALFGSVAERVLRRSPVPVFVVRPFWSYELLPPGATEVRPIGSILVPTDGSPRAMVALWPAIELAKLFDARLIFFRALEPVGKAGKAFNEASARASLKEMAERAGEEGVPTLSLVDRGEAAKSILEAARLHGCDLIAMSTHGRSGVSRLVSGSVTEQVLRGASLPILVVRAKKKAAGKNFRGAIVRAKR